MPAAEHAYRVIARGESDAELTRKIGNIVLRRHAPLGWWQGI